jgi:carboxymethylenebutenolidase
MTQLQRYLAEEIAEDHAEGHLTRREAVRRLGLLGLSASAASALLAKFATEAPAAPVATKRRRGSVMTEWAPVATQAIEFQGANGTLLAAFAPAARPRGALLVIHENRGLTAHIKNVAGRYAAGGFSALALDLLSEEGGTDALPDDAARQAALAAAPPERFDQDMKDAVTELRRRLPRKRIGAIGFCFGGAMVWRLLAAGEKRVAAAAPYYGPFPEGGDLRGARAAVFAVYAGNDARVNATQAAAAAALVAARLPHEIATFRGVDETVLVNHAFFNDTGANFNAPAAEEAYRRTFAWFDRFVAEGHDGRGRSH